MKREDRIAHEELKNMAAKALEEGNARLNMFLLETADKWEEEAGNE